AGALQIGALDDERQAGALLWALVDKLRFDADLVQRVGPSLVAIQHLLAIAAKGAHIERAGARPGFAYTDAPMGNWVERRRCHALQSALAQDTIQNRLHLRINLAQVADKSVAPFNLAHAVFCINVENQLQTD